ncbi:MAG: class I SAM-dependent methyltransferase [Candidatus Aenigmatarchaeota archaeon]|nr:MAG: class I SAM-dependent methyltransferase [Candidatus Aenigmarchaeota archaeon]
MTLNYKLETKKAYDSYAETFDKKFSAYVPYIEKEQKVFMENLKGKKILDVGCGPGNHSLTFKANGLEPLCIDISEKMVELCRAKGLDARVMDFENPALPAGQFDGLWIYTSLLHIPKEKFLPVLKHILQALKHDGVFLLGMREGPSSERFVKNPKYGETLRYFADYTEEELAKIMRDNFRILYKSKTVMDAEHVYLNYLCKTE